MPAKRLLVMDDEADFCEIVRISATSLLYDVTVLTDSKEFKATYRHLKPDTILLDVVMPNIDGVELLRWLGEQESAAKIIVVTDSSRFTRRWRKSSGINSVWGESRHWQNRSGWTTSAPH